MSPFFSKRDPVYAGIHKGIAAAEKHCSSTPVKQKAASVPASCRQASRAKPTSARPEPEPRHSEAEQRGMSGIILAGGMSSRMGKNKAELSLQGKPLLQWQVEKLRILGVEDIMISGAEHLRLPGTRAIQDEYIGRGPLGGLHACLKAAQNPHCLVLSVDVPLAPVNALYHLQRSHTGGVTVLRHDLGVEPLIGVYDSEVFQNILALIETKSAPVRALQATVSWRYFDYLGPKELLTNCNTPEDFFYIEALAASYKEKGIPLGGHYSGASEL